MAIEFGPKDRYRTYGIPSLDLPFADRKSLVDRISGNNLITFTRSTTGTYVGSDGLIKTAAVNEPRFDHNPLTRESLGLLIEEARTNNLFYSDSLSGGAWGPLDSTLTPNSALSPTGTLTGSSLIENTTSTYHGIRYPVTFSGTTTFSVFLKYVNKRYIQFTTDYADMGTWNVDIVGLTASRVSGSTSSSVTLQSFGNEWIRVCYTYVWDANNRWPNLIFASSLSTARFATYTGDGTSGIYIWGAQLESGTFPTSYIPTTTSAVTRAADVASITGSNFSSWYNQSEGTLFQNCISRAPIGGPGGSNAGAGMVMVNSITGASVGFFRRADSTALEISVYTGSVSSAFWSIAFQWPQNIASKATLAYKTNDFAVSANGLTVQTDTSGTVPTVTQLDIGQMSTATYNRIGGGTFARLTYYQTRLPDATLQELTKL